MAIDKSLYRQSFWVLPEWQCPRCNRNTLKVTDEFPISREADWSINARNEDCWEPEWINERFVALMKCQSKTCGEYVSVCGSAYPEQSYDDEGDYRWETKYQPTLIEPAPNIFQIPEYCPESVGSLLKKAFVLFWYDTASSANTLRIAVEQLLTELGEARYYNDRGKRREYKLHNRIDRYKGTNAEAGNLLEAIKWVGNTGSHAPKFDITREHLLEAFEFFDEVLQLINDKAKKDIQRRARVVNARKGKPIKKKRVRPGRR